MIWLTRLKRIILAEEFLIPFLSIFIITLSILPNAYFYLKTPPKRVYTFSHNSVSDYPYYVSFIRQGMEGRFTTIDQFTTEKQISGLIHVFYLWLGRIGIIFGFTPVMTYFFSRIVLGIGFLSTGYIFIAYFCKEKKQRIMAFIIFITSISFPQIVKTSKGIELWQYLYWWTEMDPLNRVIFIPHFLLGHIIIAASLLLLLKVFENSGLRYLLYAVGMGIMIGLIHPPSLGMVYFVMGSFLVLNRRLWFKAISFGAYVILTVPSLYYIYYTTASVFPWTLMGKQESLFYAINLPEYLLALGPILPLGLLGMFCFRHRESLILVLWVIIDILMIQLSGMIYNLNSPLKIPTFANIRFLSMSIQLPLAILSVFFLSFLKRKYGSRVSLTVFGLYVFLTLIMLQGSIQGLLFGDISSISQFIYPRKSLAAAFSFLNSRDKGNGVVLANKDISLLLPLFASNPVYYGQSVWTYNNEEKSLRADKFYSGSMTDCQAYKLLQDGRISFVMVDNTSTKDMLHKYQFLSPLYDKDDIYIFRYDEIKDTCLNRPG